MPQPFQIASDVDRADEGQDGAARLLAVGTELSHGGDRRLLGRHRLGHRIGERGRRRAGRFPAGHRVAALHAPRIEGDDVEVIEQLAGEHAELVGKVVDPRHAGTAGVDDQRADPLGRIFGQVPLQGDADCGPLRRGVVERNGQRSALQIAVARRSRQWE